jgi:hypothetical protein
VLVELGPEDLDRAAVAARLSEAVDAADGVVSLLALDERPLPGHDVVPTGLAHTLTLIQALGDAGLTAPLWVLTRGAVAAAPADALRVPDAGAGLGLGPGGRAGTSGPLGRTDRPARGLE